MTIYNINNDIQAFIDTTDLNAGDIVNILEGVYDEAVTILSGDSGALNNPVIFNGIDAIIETASGSYSWNHGLANYVEYNDLIFRGGTGAAARVGNAAGVEYNNVIFSGSAGFGWYIFSASVDIILRNVESFGNGAQGILPNSSSIEIYNLKTHDNDLQGIWISIASTGVVDGVESFNNSRGIHGLLGGITWRNLKLFDNVGHGFWVENDEAGIGSVTDSISYNNRVDASTYRHGYVIDNSDGWLINRCIAYDIDAAFVIQDSSNDNTILYCVGYRVKGANARGALSTSSTIGGNLNNAVYNTTLIQDIGTEASFEIYELDTGWNAKNIVCFHTNTGDVIELKVGAVEYPDTDYNCYISSSFTPFSDKGVNRNFADWITASSQDINSVFIHINGANYDIYLGSDPTAINQTIDYNPVDSDGRLVNRTDNPLIGGGVIIPGIHNQAEPALDLDGKPVLFTPNIGAYDGRTIEVIDGDFSPIDFEVRAGAVLIIKSGNIDLSGLTDTGEIICTLAGTVDGFTPNGINTVLRKQQFGVVRPIIEKAIQSIIKFPKFITFPFDDIDVLRAGSAFADDGTEFLDDEVFINNSLMVAEPQGVNKCLVDGVPQGSVDGFILGSIATTPTIVNIFGIDWYMQEITNVSTNFICAIDGATANTDPHSWRVDCFITGASVGEIISDVNEVSPIDIQLFPSSIGQENTTPSSIGRFIFFRSINAPIGAKLFFRLPQLVETPYIGSIIPSSQLGPTVRAPSTQQQKLLTPRVAGLIQGVGDGVELVPVPIDFRASPFTIVSGTNSGIIENVIERSPASDSRGCIMPVDVGDTYLITAIWNDTGNLTIWNDNADDAPTVILLGNSGTTIFVALEDAIYFRNEIDGVATFSKLSVQKVLPITTKITTTLELGADQSILTGDINILATDDGVQDLIYLDSSGNLKATDGINTASVPFNGLANVHYWFRVEADETTFKVGYSTDGANFTFSIDTTFSGHFPIAVASVMDVPLCGIAGPEIPVKIESVIVEPL